MVSFGWEWISSPLNCVVNKDQMNIWTEPHAWREPLKDIH